jgi:hypothetical protein
MGARKQGTFVMSIMKQRDSAVSEWSDDAELEGKIHELVRRDGHTIRRADGDSEVATGNLGNLVRRVSVNSASEIDNLIRELQLLRDKLVADGHRVEREIVEYAGLSQSVIDMTRIITESMTQVKRLPTAPTLMPKDPL